MGSKADGFFGSMSPAKLRIFSLYRPCHLPPSQDRGSAWPSATKSWTSVSLSTSSLDLSCPNTRMSSISQLSTASWAWVRLPGRRRELSCRICCLPVMPGSEMTLSFGIVLSCPRLLPRCTFQLPLVTTQTSTPPGSMPQMSGSCSGARRTR